MTQQECYQFVDLKIDLASRQVWRGQQPIQLSGLTFELLAFLLRRGQQVATPDEMMSEVWNGQVVNDETITQRIKLLRRALNDNSRSPRYIRAVRNQGYQLCAEPRRIEGKSPPHQPASYRTVVLVISITVLILGSVIFWNLRSTGPGDQASSDVSQQQPLNEDLQALLNRAGHYLDIGQHEDNERAIELYELVLQRYPGTAQAELSLSVALSRQVCQYNQPMDSLKKAEGLARGLIDRGLLTSRAHGALGYAYDCRGWMDEAIAEYRRSFELDPQNDSGLASYSYLVSIKGDLVRALEHDLKARDSGRSFRFLDIQIARNLELLGFVDSAEALYRKTFERQPDNVFGNMAYPRFLYLQGRMNEARDRLKQAIARNVPRPGLHLMQAELAMLEHDSERAVSELRQAASVNPNKRHANTLLQLADSGSTDRATDVYWQSRLLEIEKTIVQGDRWPDNWLEVALIHQHLGDTAAALNALHSAIDAGYREKNYLLISPWFSELRDSPGFSDLLNRLSDILYVQRQALLTADWLPADLLLPAKPVPEE